MTLQMGYWKFGDKKRSWKKTWKWTIRERPKKNLDIKKKNRFYNFWAQFICCYPEASFLIIKIPLRVVLKNCTCRIKWKAVKKKFNIGIILLKCLGFNLLGAMRISNWFFIPIVVVRMWKVTYFLLSMFALRLGQGF